jgi:hypothetical protein
MPSDLGPHRPEVIAVLEVTVSFEQVTDRQVRRGFAIRHGAALQDPPAPRVVRVEKLIDQARFAHTRLAHPGDDLPLADARPPEALAQHLELGVAAHEARQSPCHRRLQSRARQPRAHDRIDLDGCRQSLDGDRTEAPHLHVALG